MAGLQFLPGNANERSVMKKITLVRTLLAAISAAVIAGCASPTRTVVYQPQSGTTGSTTVVVSHPSEPPTTMQPETIPQAPDTDYIWVRGAWEWQDDRWVWSPGHWEQPHPGHEWVPGHWERTEGGYVWVSPHWR